MIEWNDPRLKHKQTSCPLYIDDTEEMDKIWLPDVFVVNAKKVSQDAKKHIKIYEDGSIQYLLR